MQKLEEQLIRIKSIMLIKEAATYTYNQALDTYKQTCNNFYQSTANIGAVEYDYNDPNQVVVLSNGKFRGARVPKQLIVDAITACKKAGLDVYTFLGLMGQESTFGNGKGEPRRYNKMGLVSGWNTRDAYVPYNLDRFLADNRVPGMGKIQNKQGLNFYVQNPEQVNTYLNQHPNVLSTYLKKLQSTPQLPSNYDDFYATAIWIKQKGIASYNPNDKGYEAAVNASINLLKTDQNLVNFLRNPIVPKGVEQTGRPRRAARRRI
jgi:hypothetical protein